MSLISYIYFFIFISLFNNINTQNGDTDYNSLDLSSLDLDFALNNLSSNGGFIATGSGSQTVNGNTTGYSYLYTNGDTNGTTNGVTTQMNNGYSTDIINSPTNGY